MQKLNIFFIGMMILTLFLNFIFKSVITSTGILVNTATSSMLALGIYEPFEGIAANWAIETDVTGTGSIVTRSSVQKRAGTYSAAAFTTNSNSKAQIRDEISSNWSDVPSTSPGAFIWQRAHVYVSSATANTLTGSEYLDLGGLYASSDSSGFYLRLKASGALHASGPGSSGQAEFNLYDTFPLDQWVEVEFGLWSRNTGDLDRAGCFIVNGKFYGWFTNGRSGTNYNRAAMGIVATNSVDDLTVYVDDWYIYTTDASPTGMDNRPTGNIYTLDYTTLRGENVGYHYNTWENGYLYDANYGLMPSSRVQSSIETSRMPDLSNGWSQIVIDWAGGNIPPWPPNLIGSFFGPMVAFRKSVELEENLEIVPIYRSSIGSVDLVFESWTIGPTEYEAWELPLDESGYRIPGQGDVIRVRWQEVSTTELRVRVDYYDASAGTWTIDAIDHTRALNNVNGVNFLADTHRAVTNTIDTSDYTIRSQTVGTLETFSSPIVTQIICADPNPTDAEKVKFTATFSKSVKGVDKSDFALVTTDAVSGASLVSVSPASGFANIYTITVNRGSGEGTIRLDVVDNDSITDASGNPLGGTGVGNGDFTYGEIYTIEIPPAIVKSSAPQDGHLFEFHENSNTGWRSNTNSARFYVGDDRRNRQYLSILSFDTSSLPDNAVILSATLNVKRMRIIGTNPFDTHGALGVEIGSPCFGVSCNLENSDFQASAQDVAGILSSFSVDNWHSAALGANIFPYIDLTGTTQFRLRFELDDNNDRGMDAIQFLSGNAPEDGRPQLIIEYLSR